MQNPHVQPESIRGEQTHPIELIWSRLINPRGSAQGTARYRRARLLATLHIILIPLGLLSIILQLRSLDGFTPTFIAVLVASVFLSLAYGANRTGHFRIPATITSILPSITAYVSLLANPDNFVAFGFLLLSPMISSMFLPLSTTAIIATVNVAGIVVLPLVNGSWTYPMMLEPLSLNIILPTLLLLGVRQRQLIEKDRQVELKQNEERYRSLFDSVPVGLYRTTTDGRILDANQALVEMLGFDTREALLKHSAEDLYVDASDRRNALEQTDQTDTVLAHSSRLRRQDGSVIWVNDNFRAIRDESGHILYHEGSLEDITHRKQLEEQLHERRRALHMIISAMPNVLLVVGENDRLDAIFLPSTFPPLMKNENIAPDEQLSQVLPEEMVDKTLTALQQVRDTRKTYMFNQSIAINGLKHHFKVRISSVTDSGDILIVIDDISAVKWAEETIQQYADELEQRNQELDGYNHMVAHDLKGPLNIVIGYVTLLRSSPPGTLVSSVDDDLEAISATAFRMAVIIDNLLKFVTIQDATEAITRVDVAQVIEDVIPRLRQQITTRGVTLDIASELPPAMGHAGWLAEVFANLLSNAIKYIGADNAEPSITVRGYAQEDMVRYEVEDNGIGIAVEDQEKLFEMFTRFHEQEAEGDGIGLPIVARIVDKLGGDLGADSTYGAGSTFWFTLPAATE